MAEVREELVSLPPLGNGCTTGVELEPPDGAEGAVGVEGRAAVAVGVGAGAGVGVGVERGGGFRNAGGSKSSGSPAIAIEDDNASAVLPNRITILFKGYSPARSRAPRSCAALCYRRPAMRRPAAGAASARGQSA